MKGRTRCHPHGTRGNVNPGGFLFVNFPLSNSNFVPQCPLSKGSKNENRNIYWLLRVHQAHLLLTLLIPREAGGGQEAETACTFPWLFVVVGRESVSRRNLQGEESGLQGRNQGGGRRNEREDCGSQGGASGALYPHSWRGAGGNTSKTLLQPQA